MGESSRKPRFVCGTDKHRPSAQREGYSKRSKYRLGKKRASVSVKVEVLEFLEDYYVDV